MEMNSSVSLLHVSVTLTTDSCDQCIHLLKVDVYAIMGERAVGSHLSKIMGYSHLHFAYTTMNTHPTMTHMI